MSSNAATPAAAALAGPTPRAARRRARHRGADFHALDGNREAFAAAVAAARPLPGLSAVSERGCACSPRGAAARARPGPVRAALPPPVAGALHDAALRLHDVLAVEINAAAENPLFADDEVLHHGGFHAAPCALALDTLRLALVPFASLSGGAPRAPDGARPHRADAVPGARRPRAARAC